MLFVLSFFDLSSTIFSFVCSSGCVLCGYYVGFIISLPKNEGLVFGEVPAPYPGNPGGEKQNQYLFIIYHTLYYEE